MYAYNHAGRVTTQEMAIAGQPNQGCYNGITFIASYQWDAYGHVATQTMGWNMYSTGGVNNQVNESYRMSYQWDNEGKS